MQITLTSLALLSGLVLAIGAVITARALKNAPDGHEDADGFHYGVEQAKPAVVEAQEAAWSHSVEREDHHAVLV